jgi:hypothetical protein
MMSFFYLKKKWGLSTSWVLCGILGLALAGCDTSKETETGSAAVEVKLQSLSSSDVTLIKITVSGEGISPSIEANLTNNSGTWSGTINNIPTGNHAFLAQAYDNNNVLVYQSSATEVAITAGNATVVTIALQQTTPPLPYSNSSPYITTATASTDQVATNNTIAFSVIATDPDNDTLTYSWTASAGTFSAENTANTTWTAPSTDGPQTISVSVNDGKDATAGASFTIKVEKIGPTVGANGPQSSAAKFRFH